MLDDVITRLTVFGALYITMVCLLPEFMIVAFNITFQLGGSAERRAPTRSSMTSRSYTYSGVPWFVASSVASMPAILVPRSTMHAPHDAMGELAMVQVADGQVRSYSYREAQGVRVVSRPEDATTDGRAVAMADMLVREGDDYMARGEFDMALNRYDRAHVLKPGDPSITYRVATTLDKQLRPIEALIQYQLFLHQMELEKIEAYGDAYAKLADAIAHARERVIILERRSP